MQNHKPDIRKSNPCPPCPPTATAFEKCVYWLGIGLGFGLPKKAAGTWGTVGGAIIALPMLLLGSWGFLIITIIGCLIGSYICGKTSDLMNTHDDPHIVFDEWVGMWIALLPSVWLLIGIPDDKSGLAYWHPSLILFLIIPFILFRFFDIIKPFPIKWVDKNVSGGFGILIDDILAGVMSAVVFALIMLIL
ncbi:phosphatidylglycerophosphatase A [Moraxella bovis]|uniref:phosphatidylglycerophosphatase A family protein n=1 Tax=Moraxella bovis TaxID=476 RepID=UPI002225E47C|nr:phosphatidylglycerophosphatase A [Moraxella bovis]UYZ70380.1 phosphatidylglycerophosphatase A [Moraxella bovis]UYZ73700.1 phosphatidylglycerophosphatase A [Moraxella bovis]UZA13680.1 phosphatidylglycerophosphatase A [Moraxella bovis]UZA43593.1 phosphatidylglycerophosphatase A [Moraxella bovis]